VPGQHRQGFKSIFYWSLENRAGVKRIEIASKPDEFVNYLDRMFSTGAFMVKEQMIEEICVDLRIPRINNLVALIKFAGKYQ
jgi:hypothetical protein